MIRKGLGTALAVLGLAAITAAGAAAQQGPIKVGSFLAVTGPISILGDPELKTLKLYVEKINGEGGVLGRKLELVSYDTGSDTKQAASFVKRLIEQDNVDILIGGSSTGETMAVIPTVEQAQIPFISFGGANVVVEPVKKWVFKTPHSDKMAVEKVYEDMKKRAIAKVALIGGPGGFDQSCMAQAKGLAKNYGIEVVGEETYGAQDTDVTPQLSKLRGAPGLQAVFSCGFGAAPIITARNYKQLGIDKPLYMSHGVASKEFITGSGEAAEGIRLPVAAVLVAEQLPDSHPQKKVSLEYVKTYKAKWNEDISTFGGHAYDGLMIAVEAMKRAGSADKAKVRDEIEKTKNFVGADGIFNMSPTDHLGIGLDSFQMVEIKGGDWKLSN